MIPKKRDQTTAVLELDEPLDDAPAVWSPVDVVAQGDDAVLPPGPELPAAIATLLENEAPRLQENERAGALGAGALAQRAETELRATGAKPRRVQLTGLEALTASERRIAELAAEGLTNREIAQTLFVTPRTVEGHLTNVFNKLDVKARTGLPAALGSPTQAVHA